MRNGILLLAATLSILNGNAQNAGSLDPSFGIGGKVVTSVSSGTNKAYGVAVQPDGKIIVAGYATNTMTGKDFAIVRYNADGSIDNSFGNNGIVTSDLQLGSDDVAYSVALQLDGKIIAAGYSDNGFNKDAAIVRYNDDGSFDTNFGNNGIVITDFENSQMDEIKVVKIHPFTGNIIVGGASNVSSTIGKPIIARYLSDGSLDATFNSTGIKSLWVAVGDNNRIFSVEDLVVESSGKISCVGWRKYISTSIGIEYWAARVLSNGAMDVTFSTDGVIAYGESTGASSGYGMAFNSNQDFILCGTRQYNGNYSFRTLKINQNGTIPNVSVSYTGYINGINKANKIVMENNGNFIFAGTSGTSANSNFTIGKINNSSLAPETAFGTSGFTNTSFGNAINDCYNVAIQQDNKIVAVGFSGDDFAIARYLGEDTPELNGFQLISPSDLSLNQSFTSVGFDWSDAFLSTSYELDIDTSPTFSNSPQTFSATTSNKTIINLTPSTQYYWRVRASDGTNWGNYSSVWSFTTNSLNNFNLISPSNNASNQNYATLPFDWSDNQGATNYELDIDTSPTFSNSPQTFSAITSNKTLINLTPNTQYYWRVRASDGTNWGSYSSIWSFTTNALENFSLVSPLNNAANQNYLSLPLDWTDNSGATNYEVEIALTQNFASGLQNFGTVNSNYTLNLQPMTTYFWHVRASNGVTWGQWSVTWEFTTKSDSSTGISEIDSFLGIIFPNPTTGIVSVKSDEMIQMIQLTDINGRIVTSLYAISKNIEIDLTNLISGVYFIKIQNENGDLITRKIVKK